MLQVIIVYKSQFSVEIKLPQFCKVILYPYIMAGVQLGFILWANSQY